MSPFTLIDAHQDIAMNYVGYGRDFRHGLYDTRARESAEADMTENTATSALDAALAANVGLIFATLFVNPPWEQYGKVYHTPEEADEQAQEQVACYDELATHPNIHRVFSRADLDAVRSTWDRPAEERVIGLVTLMEGADPIQTPDDFGLWYERGVRIVGLTWSQTRYAGGTLMNGIGGGPITAEGFALMEQIARYNAVLDLSHMSEEAYYQALEAFGGVMIASHSNPRRFRDKDRHLSDDMIVRLAERGGVIGLVPYTRFLTDNDDLFDDKSNMPLRYYTQAIDTICQLTGSAYHAGIGSDIDGGFGSKHLPTELDSLADFQYIAEDLSDMGYRDEDIALICHGNFLRILEQTLPAC